jgi:hypothetical protein
VTPDPGTIVLVVTTAIAVVVWLVRQEGRINALQAEIKNLKESDLHQIRRDVEYIRGRIDNALEKT